MEFGICTLNNIAIRAEASEQSEMSSQLLFGETCRILKSKTNWHKIRCDFDQYEGWVHQLELRIIPESVYQEINQSEIIAQDMVSMIGCNDLIQTISIGARLPLYANGDFKIDTDVYTYDGLINQDAKTKKDIVQTAYLFLNAPYLWGGRTPFGLDCSGFTQMVYKINGYKLLRNAAHQASQGEVLSFIEESEPGDLAFFDNQDGEIIHVGIILANNYIIHCHGKVRLDRLDQSGIYNIDTKRHTHKLRVMKRLF